MTVEPSSEVIYWALAGLDLKDRAMVFIRGEPGWQRVFESDLSEVRGDLVVVAVEHVILRTLVDVLRRRATRASAPVGVARVTQVIGERGWVVESAYRVWPSLDRPRVAIPKSNTSLAAWMQRTGVLGGGRAILVRAALRSRVATPLMLKTARATALVLRRRAPDAASR